MTGHKISLFLPDLRSGGAQKVFINLANAFASKGYEVDLVLQRAEGPMLTYLDPQVNLVRLNTANFLLSLYKLLQYCKKTQADVFYSALNVNNMLTLLLRFFTKGAGQFVVSFHAPVSRMIRTAPKKLIERSFFSLMLPAADKIVAVSHLVAKDLSEQTGMPLEKIDVIYNPVLPDNLKTLAAAVPQHPWFNEDAPPVVLVVARLEEQKDLFTLIWAFQRIRERKQARLVIFGEGPLKAALKKKIRALQLEDDVDLAGFTSNPYPYMVRADVFALTSSFEGLPTVLIEALALGCPIVSTSSYGGVQEVLPYGQHGSLVPVGDHKAVADAILRVMENGADIKVSAEWLAQFTIDTALKNYIELFGFV